MPERSEVVEGPLPRFKVLIVDDEDSSSQAAKMILQPFYDTTLAPTAEDALILLAEETFDLVLMDLKMPGMGGMTGLRRMRSSFPCLPVIIMTAYQTVPTAIEAMKLGASDYLIKPFDVPQLREVISRNLGHYYSAQVDTCGSLMGRSLAMRKIFSTIHQVADKDVTVLVTGESGTGKELVAEAIHRFSPRHNQPFVVVNCAAIPESLIESELFGHEKGAFTNADRRRLGQFEIAHLGTIFLDEIGELSLATQSKLLRVIQSRSFHRVGGNEEIRVNVRIVAATNRPLEEEVRSARFREDLYFRLNVVQLRVPPLRERREDIIPLAEHFLSESLRAANKPPRNFSNEVADLLETYPWPGNVRELVNVMERAAVLSHQQEILPGDLPENLRPNSESPIRFLRGNGNGHGLPMEFADSDSQALFDETVSALEGKLIREALAKTGGVQTSAAKYLGISRRILKYKMDKLGIQN